MDPQSPTRLVTAVNASLRIAATVPCTSAEGPFERFALWVQGCSLRCRGCCNPTMFTPSGPASPVERVIEAIAAAHREHGIEGVTLLGGEPLEQADALLPLCDAVRGMGLGVLLFSGYRREEIERCAQKSAVWARCDTLVDGRYEADDPEPRAGRRFIGSRNQRLHHRTDRYADPRLWEGPARVEVHVDADGRIHAHGSPGALASLLATLPHRNAQRR